MKSEDEGREVELLDAETLPARAEELVAVIIPTLEHNLSPSAEVSGRQGKEGEC